MDSLAAIIVKREWLLLLVISPFLLLPSPATIPLLFAIPVIWVACRISTGRLIPITPLNLPILLLLVMLLVSIIISQDLPNSTMRVSGLVLGIGVFYGVMRFSSSVESWTIAFQAYLWGGTGLAAIALVGTDWLYKIDPLIPITERLPPRLSQLIGPEGTFHPNIVAGALLWILPIMIAAAIGRVAATPSGQAQPYATRNRAALVLSLAGLSLVLGVFLLLQSRGAYIAIVLACAAAFSIALREWRQLEPTAVILFLAVAVALAAFMAAASFGGLSIIEDGIRTGDLAAVANSLIVEMLGRPTVQGRMELWSRGVDIIGDFPLTGVGIGAFQSAVERTYSLQLVPRGADFVHPHNHILAAAVDLGIPGLIAYLWMWVGISVLLHKTWILAESDLTQLFVLGFSASLLAYFLFGLTDAIALGTKPGVIWWYLLGLIVALYKGVAHEDGWEKDLPSLGSKIGILH